jgi:hypothetical protein
MIRGGPERAVLRTHSINIVISQRRCSSGGSADAVYLPVSSKSSNGASSGIAALGSNPQLFGYTISQIIVTNERLLNISAMAWNGVFWKKTPAPVSIHW